MNSIKQLINAPVITIVLIAGAFVAHEALGRRQPTGSPAVIAAIRMEVLFDGLQQRAEAKAELDRLEAGVVAARGAREAGIKQLEDELENAVGATNRQEVEDKIALAKLELQFSYQEAAAELEIEKALRLQQLYLTIKRSLKQLAQAEGYDMVILDDSIDALQIDRESRIPPQVQGLQQIMSHKLLYLMPTIDITEDLVTRMNNEYRTGRAGP